MPIVRRSPYEQFLAQSTQRSALGGPSPSVDDLYSVVLAQQESARREDMERQRFLFQKEEAEYAHQEAEAQTRAQAAGQLTQLPITAALTYAQLKQAGILGGAALGTTGQQAAVGGGAGAGAPGATGTASASVLPPSIFSEAGTASWGTITGTQMATVGGIGAAAGYFGATYGPGKMEDVGRIGTFGLAKGKTATVAGGAIKGAGAGAAVGVWFGGVGAAVGAIGGAVGGALAGSK